MSDPALQAAIYLHIPLCRAKCTYCDFFSVPAAPSWYAPYVDALSRHIAWAASRLCIQARTLYLGGGTPTVLPPALLVGLLETCFRHFGEPSTGEVTIEANPGTLSRNSLEHLAQAGVTRLSLGVQSFDEGELRLLGRIHTAQEAETALEDARAAGFREVNLDLIFGLPGQSLRAWEHTLEKALSLHPDHLSAYALTLEPGTPLARDVAEGRLAVPDDDLAAAMYQRLERRLADAGFRHYEISNWARWDAFRDHRCQHNLIYWRNEPWLGFGAGAHSYAFGHRWHEVEDLATYVKAWRPANAPPLRAPLYASLSAREAEAIPREVEMAETAFLGLRLVEEGVPVERFRRRFGLSPQEAFPGAAEELKELGLLRADDERIALTPRGRLLANQVFLRFLPPPTAHPRSR
ncbi:MAG: radical SAM family heme chaperone HemW [Anaerolineae bacterium]